MYITNSMSTSFSLYHKEDSKIFKHYEILTKFRFKDGSQMLNRVPVDN